MMKITLILSLCVAGAVHFVTAREWSFNPGEDRFLDEAMLDLRYLNEAEAGQHGFVALSEDGESFVRGDGRPLRFWSACTRIDLHPVPAWTLEEIESFYRFLAKRGVNLVRVFGQLPLLDPDKPLSTINPKQLDVMHRHVAVAKQHGIYLFLTPYWGHEVEFQSDWGQREGDMPYSMVFWEEHLQQAYKDWFRKIYGTVNPYTGMAIKDDPSVAVIQVHNEDSILFWTFNALTPRQLKVVGAQFSDWVTQRYGSLPKALSKWGGAIEGDSIDEGVLAMQGLHVLMNAKEGPDGLRLRDQMEYMVEIQRRFYDEMAGFLRDEVGCQQLLNACNWRTAHSPTLDDLERYTYAGLEVMAVNRFVTGPHVGAAPGWRIEAGDRYVPLSTLKNPLALPVSVRAPRGFPFLLTETTWVAPNPWQVEGPFVAAAYMGLTGFDSAFFFSSDSVEWKRDASISSYPGSIHKWHANVPQFAGQFPAPALAHRLGYITEAATPAVLERRTKADLLDRVPAQPSEEQGFDPNRDSSYTQSDMEKGGEIDPLAFLVGPVKVELDATRSQTETVDLSRYINRESGTIRSLTDEVLLNFKQGVCIVDTPCFQGTAAFFHDVGGIVNTRDLRIHSKNEYGTVMAVSMDEQPLVDSKRILLQTGTVTRPKGWKESPATLETEDTGPIEGYQIDHVGTPPWSPRQNQTRIDLNNASISKATVLDANGYAREALDFQRVGDWISLQFPPDALYVLLEE